MVLHYKYLNKLKKNLNLKSISIIAINALIKKIKKLKIYNLLILQ
jgi:hypothetical protein